MAGQLDWLRIRNEGDLKRIPGWMKGRRCNTYNRKPDKNGNQIMLLGYDDRPDSDWGRFKGNSAAIWFASDALADAAEATVQRGLGWKPA